MTEAEFNERVLPLRHKVFRLAVCLTGDTASGEDAAQEVMERMWRKRSSLGGIANTEWFVMRSARNYCYDVLRRRKTAKDKAEPIDPREDNPMPEIERVEIREMVSRAIALLPEKQRLAIHLRDIEGYEFEEMAVMMECDLPSVRVYLSRARKAVAEKLKNYV